MGGGWSRAKTDSPPGAAIANGAGLYESLITQALSEQLAHLQDVDIVRGGIPDADEPEVLARHVRQAVARALAQEGETLIGDAAWSMPSSSRSAPAATR